MMENSKELTEDLVDVLSEFVSSQLEQVYTCVPGIIQSYNATTKLAKVLLQVRLPMSSGEIIELPPIENVPVQRIETSEFFLDINYPAGTGCLVLFSSVSLGNWINASTGVVDPDNLAKFSLTDAIAIPSIYPKNGAPSASRQVKIAVSDGNLTMTTPDGNEIKASGTSVTINGNLEVLQ